ncbi:MAG TPA: hypothetical protein VGB89_04725 [Bacteroidota bacterium]|jgi:rRNA-processing protein FCF1
MKKPSMEFEAYLGQNGEVAVPKTVLEQLKGKNRRVRVRITDAELSDRLRTKGVEEEEIDRIASLQMESRSQVIAFLLSEGQLRGVRKRNRR